MHRQFDVRRVVSQGKCTQKELDDLKMLVVEVGIDTITQSESYLSFILLHGRRRQNPRGIRLIIGGQKDVVESNVEPSDHPQI